MFKGKSAEKKNGNPQQVNNNYTKYSVCHITWPILVLPPSECWRRQRVWLENAYSRPFLGGFGGFDPLDEIQYQPFS